MKTITELMEGHEHGSIKIAAGQWGSLRYFSPVFQTDGKWHGKNQSGEYAGYEGHISRWAIYQEPVEMEDRWQWVTPGGLVSLCMYSCDEVKTEFHQAAFRLECTKTQFPKEKK